MAMIHKALGSTPTPEERKQKYQRRSMKWDNVSRSLSSCYTVSVLPSFALFCVLLGILPRALGKHLITGHLFLVILIYLYLLCTYIYICMYVHIYIHTCGGQRTIYLQELVLSS